MRLKYYDQKAEHDQDRRSQRQNGQDQKDPDRAIQRSLFPVKRQGKA